MTKTRRAGFSKKRRRGGRKTMKRRGGFIGHNVYASEKKSRKWKDERYRKAYQWMKKIKKGGGKRRSRGTKRGGRRRSRGTKKRGGR